MSSPDLSYLRPHCGILCPTFIVTDQLRCVAVHHMIVNPNCVPSKSDLIHYALQVHHNEVTNIKELALSSERLPGTNQQQNEHQHKDTIPPNICTRPIAGVGCVSIIAAPPRKSASIYLLLCKDSRKPEPDIAGMLASGCVFETD